MAWGAKATQTQRPPATPNWRVSKLECKLREAIQAARERLKPIRVQSEKRKSALTSAGKGIFSSVCDPRADSRIAWSV